MALLIGFNLHFVITPCAGQKFRIREVMFTASKYKMTLHEVRVKVMSDG